VSNAQAPVSRQSLMDMFVAGARRGWNVATNNMVPNVIMAFVLIQALNVTGLLEIVGKAFGPVMALWGLPGEAAAALIASFLSMGGGVGVTASLYTAGKLSGPDVTVLMPAIFLMGALLQFMGRCLGTAGVDSRHYPVIIGVCIANALLSMWVMRLILILF